MLTGAGTLSAFRLAVIPVRNQFHEHYGFAWSGARICSAIYGQCITYNTAIDHFSLQGSAGFPICFPTACVARENPVNRWIQNVEAQEKLQPGVLPISDKFSLTVFVKGDFSREWKTKIRKMR